MASFQELLSSFKNYTWHFSLNYNPTSISCISRSEQDARQQIIDFLTRIDSTFAEYRKAMREGNLQELEKWYPIIAAYEIDATLNIGCYTRDIYDYSLDMEIDKYKNDADHYTLADYIMQTAPRVSSVKSIHVFSCLDG